MPKKTVGNVTEGKNDRARQKLKKIKREKLRAQEDSSKFYLEGRAMGLYDGIYGQFYN